MRVVIFGIRTEETRVQGTTAVTVPLMSPSTITSIDVYKVVNDETTRGEQKTRLSVQCILRRSRSPLGYIEFKVYTLHAQIDNAQKNKFISSADNECQAYDAFVYLSY